MNSRAALSLTLAMLLATAACQRDAPRVEAKKAPAPKEETAAVENGAISVAPVAPEAPRPAGNKNPRTAKIDWSPVKLESGQAWVSCDLDYSRSGDGAPLPEIDRESLIT